MKSLLQPTGIIGGCCFAGAWVTLFAVSAAVSSSSTCHSPQGMIMIVVCPHLVLYSSHCGAGLVPRSTQRTMSEKGTLS